MLCDKTLLIYLFICRNPTPSNDPITFKPIHKDIVNFVDISNEGLIPALGPHKKFMSFWTDLLGRYDTYLHNVQVKDEL